jgi:ribonuclease D
MLHGGERHCALGNLRAFPLAAWSNGSFFGERALELKRGRLALTVENGKVVTLEWRDAEEQPKAT